MPAPYFSVIIPLYNKRPYIGRAINSVLAQTCSDFELIVVDDGSTDGSHEAVVDVMDPRCRLVRQANAGGAGGQARNTGMALARGAWFAFLDGDDMWLPSHLTELRRIIHRHPEAGLVSPKSSMVNEGVPIHVHDDPAAPIRKIEYFRESAKHIGIINASSSAIDRRIFKQVGGFLDVRSGPDLEYWARIALKYPVSVSSRFTSIYFRANGGNMEQIGAQPINLLEPISSLRDLSPSVRMLCDVAENDAECWRNPGIRAYVNSRVWHAVKGALYRRDVARARELARLFIHPVPWEARALRLAVASPAPAVGVLASLYQSIKSRHR